MHLIKDKLSGKEIPETLPPSLVPPSMRSDGPSPPFLHDFEVDGINRVERDVEINEAVQEADFTALVEMDAVLWASFALAQSPVSPQSPVSSPSPQSTTSPSHSRSGLCVVCQEEEANVAIVDCGCVICVLFPQLKKLTCVFVVISPCATHALRWFWRAPKNAPCVVRKSPGKPSCSGYSRRNPSCWSWWSTWGQPLNDHLLSKAYVTSDYFFVWTSDMQCATVRGILVSIVQPPLYCSKSIYHSHSLS
jgi:hypothetical protein